MTNFWDLGSRIKEKRHKLGMTQEYLADRLHVTSATIANWEHGRSEPSVYDLYEMSVIFQTSMEEILNRDKNPKNL